MRVAQKFAGYSLEEADNLRKACGKKIRALIAAEREKFVAGCVTEGYGEKLGHRAVRHHRALRRLRLQQVALLRLRAGGLPDGLAQGPLPGRVHGGPVDLGQGQQGQDGGLPGRVPGPWASPCCRPTSTARWPSSPPTSRATASGQAILFGMAAVRNVGEGLVERIVAERDGQRALRRHLRLLPAGRPDRPQQAHDGVVGQGRRLRRPGPPPPGPVPGHGGRSWTGRSSGAASATWASPRCSPPSRRSETDPGWGDAKIAIPDTEFDKAQRLAFEKEMLGLYVSDHPLMGYEQALARHTDCSLSDMREEDAAAASARRCGRSAGW